MQTYKIYINDRPLILTEGNNILDFPAVPDAHLISLYQGNKRFLLNYVDALEKGGRLILSGLLNYQVEEVIDLYSKKGLKVKAQLSKNDWSALLLEK